MPPLLNKNGQLVLIRKHITYKDSIGNNVICYIPEIDEYVRLDNEAYRVSYVGKTGFTAINDKLGKECSVSFTHRYSIIPAPKIKAEKDIEAAKRVIFKSKSREYL